MSKIWRVLDIINWGSDYFSGKGIESPRLNIELLLCDLMKYDRIDLYTQYEKPLKENELALLKDMVIRRAKREPLQHITKKAFFMDLELYVDQNVLIPRPETELLVDLMLRENDTGAEYKILDIGTGSGCISISLAARFKKSWITGTDYSEKALSISEVNAEKYKLPNLEFMHHDIMKSNFNGTKYDIIVSNPPYIPKEEFILLEPEVHDYEPRLALTDNGDGLSYYRRFNDIFYDLLNPGGKFYLEIGFGQKSEILNIFDKDKYDLAIHQDLSKIDRIISGRIKS